MQLIITHHHSQFSHLSQQTGFIYSLQWNSFFPSSLHSSHNRKVCSPEQLAWIAEARNNPRERFGRTIAYKSLRCTAGTEQRELLAPLELESAEGQLLMNALQNHGNGPRAAREQLEFLAADCKLATNRERKSGHEGDGLHRRIASIKEKEKTRIIQDIMYALVVERFVKADLGLTSPLALAPACERKADFASEVYGKRVSLLPLEVQELIQEHIAMVIGGRNPATRCQFDPRSLTRISKLTLGKIYAASAMYGYFLRRVHQRLKLDQQLSGVKPGGGASDGLEEELKAYLRRMAAETRKRLGQMKVKESVQLIERHVEALCGKPEEILMQRREARGAMLVNSATCELCIALSKVESLALEALAFGSVLWDVEAFVASVYPLSPHAE